MTFSDSLLVIRHVRCAPSYRKLTVDAPVVARAAAPGQFFMVRVPSGGTDPFLRRPMSLHRPLRDDGGNPVGFELLYRVVGRGTERLSQVRVGESIEILGPLGRGFTIDEGQRNHVIVAGGCGVAPMAALVESLASTGGKPIVLYGGRTADDIVCVDDFQACGADLRLFTEDGSLGVRGLVTEGLAETLRASANTIVYACGPIVMLSAVARISEQAGATCQVSLEALMGCGLGACMSCAVRARSPVDGSEYLRICKDGPVFDSRDIFWEPEA